MKQNKGHRCGYLGPSNTYRTFVDISLLTPFLNIYSYMPTRTREVVYTFFKTFDRNVKLYQSTEKCPNRALHNLVTLGGRAKAHFCRCTFLLISISTDLCNKKVPHFTLHFLHIFQGGRFFQKEWGQHISVVGGGGGVF